MSIIKSIIIYLVIALIYSNKIVNSYTVDDDYQKQFKVFPDNKNPISAIITDPKQPGRTFVIGKYQTQTPLIDKTGLDGFWTIGSEEPIEKPTTKPIATKIPAKKGTTKAPEEPPTNNKFSVVKAAMYGGCLAFIGKTADNNTFFSIFNTNMGPEGQMDINADHEYTSIGIDDTFVWLTYKEKGQTILTPFVHSNEQGKCTEIIKKKDSYVPYAVNITDSDSIISQPNTAHLRHLYIYDKTSHVLVKYDYSPDLNKLEEVEAGRLNIGSACSIQLYRYDQSTRNTYWMASYQDHFEVYNDKSEKSIQLSIENDTHNYCSPFAANDLDVFYTKPDSNELFRTMPGVSFETTHPCFGQSNGEIKIIAKPGIFKFKWDDQTEYADSMVRSDLPDGEYRVQFNLAGIDLKDDVVRRRIKITSPMDPTYADISNTCRNDASGIIHFNSTHHTDLTYSYTFYDVAKNQTYTNTNSGILSKLFGDSDYIANITTVDQFGHQCVYPMIKMRVKNDNVEEVKIEAINATCYDSKDAQIKILNYKPKKYDYTVTPAKFNITEDGRILNIDVPNIVITPTIKGGSCTNIKSVDILSPPSSNSKLIYKLEKPKCYGGTGHLIVNVIKGVEFILTDSSLGDKVLHPYLIGVNGTTRFKNLPAGTYNLQTIVKSLKGDKVCSAINNPIKIYQPKRIQIIDTYIESVDCKNDNLANMTIYASGGTPINGTNYDYSIGLDSRFRGSYLNVSYWIDGVYSLNVSDHNQCVTSYMNITIKRPSKCQVRNINGIHPQPKPNGLQSNNNGNGDGDDSGDKKEGSKLGLILGLCLGIGIPFMIIATALAVILVKKYGHLNRSPNLRNQARPNTVPVFMGGKIHSLDNF